MILSASASLCVGIFVGGASRRMGRPKGLILEPAEHQPPAESMQNAELSVRRRTLVERLAEEARGVLSPSTAAGRIVLVGARPEYEHLGLPQIRDEMAQTGPLGGLVALLKHADAEQVRYALALACDQPYVTRELLERVVLEQPNAVVHAPRQEGYWQPLCARYDVARALPDAARALASGHRKLQRLLDDLGARSLELSPSEARLLTDWDTPEDMAEDNRHR